MTAETIREIGELPYVRNYEYTMLADFFIPSLERYIPTLGGITYSPVEDWFGELGYPYRVRGVRSPYFFEIEQNDYLSAIYWWVLSVITC